MAVRLTVALLALGLGLGAGIGAARHWQRGQPRPGRPEPPQRAAGPAPPAAVTPAAVTTRDGGVADAALGHAASDRSESATPLDPSLPTRGLPGAAARGDIRTLIRELDLGASPETRDSQGRNAFAVAAQAGQVTALEVLLDRGVNPGKRTHSGATALMLAARAGRTRAVEWLLAHGAKVNAHDRQGHSALVVAAMEGRLSVLEPLLQAGARLELPCQRGLTVLMHAARDGAFEVVTLLAQAGAKLEARSPSGATALALAVDAGWVETTRLLLSAGARLDTANQAGLTPLGYALIRRPGAGKDERKRRARVARLLADAGADFEPLRTPRLAATVDRVRFDTLAARRGLAPLDTPSTEARASMPEHVKVTPKGAAMRVLRLLARTPSRRLPKALDDRLSAYARDRWRVPNIMRQVRIKGLVPRAAQRITLAGDLAGQWGFGVDDAILFEVVRSHDTKRAFFIGILDGLRLSGETVARVGPAAYRHGADAVDLTAIFRSGHSVVLSAIDWGGQALVSDVFLRVLGPGADDTLRKATMEVMR